MFSGLGTFLCKSLNLLFIASYNNFYALVDFTENNFEIREMECALKLPCHIHLMLKEIS